LARKDKINNIIETTRESRATILYVPFRSNARLNRYGPRALPTTCQLIENPEIAQGS